MQGSLPLPNKPGAAMRDISAELDLIYETAFVPDNWERVLDGMARAVGGEGTVLFNTSAASSRFVASDGISDLIGRILAEDWTSRNHRAERLVATPHFGFQNEAEQFTEEEYNTFPIYTDLMQPLGYGFGAGTLITVPSGDNVVFSVEKKRANGPMDGAAIAYLDSLRPHLARAAMLSSRLAFERVNAAVQALELTGLPSAVLGAGGRVLAANRLLEQFAPQITIGANDRITFGFAEANARLAGLTAMEQSSLAVSASFPLPQVEGRPPAVVHLVPVRGHARDLFVHASFFLIATPVDRTRVPTAETIQGLFDLTPAEARVARSLSLGNDVARTAADFSLSPETVRSHVKSILGKCGMSRQTDFIASVASIRPIGSVE